MLREDVSIYHPPLPAHQHLHLPQSPLPASTRHSINGWIDRYPNVQGSCTRRSRSKDQEHERPYWVVGSRVHRNHPLATPPGRHTPACTVGVYVPCTCTLALDASRRATCGTTYAWEYHYLSCVFSVNCHYRRNLVTGCIPP